MSFGLWHWLIVIAITLIAFHRQLPTLILYLIDPGRALRHRLGLLGAKDREAMLRKRERIRLELRQKGSFFIVAALVLIIAWKALSYLPASSQP